MTIIERTTAYWMLCWAGSADQDGVTPEEWADLFYAYGWRN